MKYLVTIIALFSLMRCGNSPPAPGPTPPGPTPSEPGEPIEYATGLIKPKDRHYGVAHVQPAKKHAAPENFSWNEKFATPVRNQGNCGSCWAFGGTQTLEMGYKIFGGKTIDFSEQDLVGKLFYGCGGGYFTGKFQVDNGQTDEESCKYSASNKKCPSTALPVGKGLSWGLVGQPTRKPSEDELKEAILSYGAISVTVTAGSSFSNYKSGFAQTCPHGNTNHIVALTGWKTNPADGKTYFEVKNSWGEGWGEKGYGYFRAGCHDLAEEASWIAVDKVPCPPPAVKLPAEYVLHFQDEVLLSVKVIPGVTYSWWKGATKLGDGPTLTVFATESMDLLLRAVNQCGTVEILTKITVKQ